MKATIYDVSRLSGVSTATVSRTFSAPEQVREDTRRRVYEAASALKYTPNAIARDMALQRTNRIAYLICKRQATILDEFYAGICEGIMRRANALNLQLIVSTADDWRQMAANAQSKQVEGVILGGDVAPAMVSEFQARNTFIVLVNNRMEGFDLPCVVSDERQGIRQAAQCLAEAGHRRIALMMGGYSPFIVGERYAGFIEAMAALRLPVTDADVTMCDRTAASAAESAMKLLSGPDRPTAVLAVSDVVAAGVMKAARRLGLSVPGELAVTGYDDSAICTLLEPELTSVHIDVRRMGETAVNLLCRGLEGEDTPRLTVIPTQLTRRGSV